MKKIFALVSLIAAMTLTSCVKDQIYGGATISNIKNTIAYTELDAVTVTATVEALVPIQDVTLKYYTREGQTPVEVNMVEANGSVYGAVIPAQAKDVTVTYWIVAKTASYTVESAAVSYTVGATPIDYTGLRLNELNGNDKFIELYNSGKNDIPVAGIKVQKDGKDVWTSGSAILSPGGFILLYSEDVVVSGGAQEGYDPALVFTSGLSAKKNVRVQLFDPAGNSLDDFNLTNIQKTAPASYSRNSDGKWYHADATPGKANKEGTDKVEGLEGGDPVKVAGSAILNELNGNDKFIEIANPGDEDFSIEGYKIYKDGTDAWTAPSGCKVPAKGFVLLYSADVTADHPDHPSDMFFSTGLSAKKAVKVQLVDKKSADVDVFNYATYMGSPAPASYGRNADGKWYLQDATPGKANKDGSVAVTGLE